jgi:hypothetical protein
MLTAALYANEYLAVQFKATVGRLNPFESQLATTAVAVRRGRRLDQGAHMISFRSTGVGTREWNARKSCNFILRGK